MLTFLISALVMGVILKLTVLDWFVRGCKNPYRYRVVEKNAGWSYPQWKSFWWPFWFSYTTGYNDRTVYYNTKAGAEAHVMDEINNHIARQVKTTHYYPQHPAPIAKTEIQIP